VSRWLLPLGVLVAVVVVLLLVGGGSDDGPPLQADGTGAAGAKAMVLLLEELGAQVDVDVAVPDRSVESAVLLRDRLADARRQDLLDWVADGGTLVVSDPRSPLTPPGEPVLGAFGIGDVDLEPETCDVDELAVVGTVRPGGGALYEVGGGQSCFGDGADAYVVSTPHGRGRVVAVGNAGPFTNQRIDEVDNAVLVAQLLAPEPEGSRVAFLDQVSSGPGATPGEGEDDLIDLVPDRVLLALLQLAIAFLAYAAFRARRVGRPVAEPLPTTIAGSELVAAVGELRLQERAPERSAALLRDDLHRTLARRLGIPPDAALEELVAVAERAGADPDRLRRVLAGPPATDGEQLTVLARDIDRTRQEVFHEQH
jgi:hypothetical protein